MQNNSINILDILAILSIVLQLQVYEEAKREATNDDLMGELQRQDREYLERIIENQNLILEKLAELG